MTQSRIAAVIIGRNEGERLLACLASTTDIPDRIYVDSGSTDGSVAAARDAGAHVVELDLATPFTAARARNAGVAALKAEADYIQFIDGDCALAEGWLDKAVAALDADPGLAVVCGRRRERFPEATLYNAICDREWNTPVGEAKACGGDALMRLSAFQAVGGFRGGMIAGEEPELCFRLRRAGWRIQRIDADMTLHDAAMTRFGQWWRRAQRAGHAYAEGAWLHGASSERYNLQPIMRALAWSAMGPLAILATLAGFGPALIASLVYPAQIARLWRRYGDWRIAALGVLDKFAHTHGALQFLVRRIGKGSGGIIEYK